MSDEDELLDLVDENDKVIDKIKRVDYYRLDEKPSAYLRSSELFIRNSQGQLWVPRRTADKMFAANGLDYSCGGHVTSGQDYLASLVREAQEELNLNLDPSSLTFIHKFNPTKDLPWFRSVYLYEQNEVPDYNRADFQAYYWLTPEELLAKLEAGELAKSSMLETVRTTINKLSLSA
jgi:isopentenyldiphosphate isomerase